MTPHFVLALTALDPMDGYSWKYTVKGGVSDLARSLSRDLAISRDLPRFP